VHVRVAPSHGRPRLNTPAQRLFPRTGPTLLAAFLLGCGVGSDRPGKSPAANVEWTLSPTPAAVGPAVLELRVLDSAGRRVNGAWLQVEAHMSHPGMAPVMASASELTPGTYRAQLHLTMPGDWLFLVTGSLPGGESVRYQIDLPRVRPH
jgi:hypothetical protein